MKEDLAHGHERAGTAKNRAGLLHAAPPEAE